MTRVLPTLLILLIIAWSSVPSSRAADPNILCIIVHDRCAPSGQHLPCLKYHRNIGFALRKDIVGRTRLLLLPTGRITGLEDRKSSPPPPRITCNSPGTPHVTCKPSPGHAHSNPPAAWRHAVSSSGASGSRHEPRHLGGRRRHYPANEPEFILLASSYDPLIPGSGAAQELQDHTCALATQLR